jgi:hypothetical protein
MDEPQALLDSWNVMYLGLDSVETESYRIKTSGYDQYKLEFTDGDGNQATIPLVYAISGTNLKMGDDNDDLVLKGSTKITRNDYLIVTDNSQDDGRRKTYALRYKGADPVATGEIAKLKFDKLSLEDGTVKRIEAAYVQTDGDTPGATLKLGGATFGVINASDDTIDNFDIWVDLDADGIIENDNTVVHINTNAGARIKLEEGTDSILATFDTPNADDYDNIVPTPVKLKIFASGGEVGFEEAIGSDIRWMSPSEEVNIKYAYTSRGAKFRWENPAYEPDLLTVEYPKEQRLPLVYIVGTQ